MRYQVIRYTAFLMHWFTREPPKWMEMGCGSKRGFLLVVAAMDTLNFNPRVLSEGFPIARNPRLGRQDGRGGAVLVCE